MDQPFYNYKIVSGLDINIDEYLQIAKLDKIHICSYEISNKGKIPFLKYIFVKYEYEDVPHQKYTEFRSSQSQGNFFNKNISKTYKYTKL